MRCLLLLLAGLAAASAFAEEALSPAERLRQAIEDQDAPREVRREVWRNYPAAPAREALSPDLYDYYAAALAREECEAVLPFLIEAYLRRYPELKDAFASRDVIRSWIGDVAGQAYPEHELCEAKKGPAR